mmetsp:Transcript_93382/g.267186  ORF Transcript_93382/g.267186 Transcript_93382/m.267186 type:complete len:138 (-) Transcript_93382:302-715(-)
MPGESCQCRRNRVHDMGLVADALEVPTPFIVGHIKTSREAATLINLSTTAHRLDELLKATEVSALGASTVRGHWSTIQFTTGKSELASLLPLLSQTEAVERLNVERMELQVMPHVCESARRIWRRHDYVAHGHRPLL